MKWQPIETAPKNGRPILLIGQSKNAMIPQVGFYNKFQSLWALDDGENCHLYDRKNYIITISNPTHWMPLPESPNS